MSKYKKYPDNEIDFFDESDLTKEQLEEMLDYCYDYGENYDSYPYSDRRTAPPNVKIDFYSSFVASYVKELEKLVKNIKPSTYQVISGSGPAWFYEPTTKRLIKTERGSEVVVIPGEVDEFGRLLVRTMNTFILIPCEEVLDVGYN